MFGKKSSAGGNELAKVEKKAARQAKKANRKATKADTKSAKAAEKDAPKGLIGMLTDPKTAKRALSVAKVAGPMVAPAALKAATAARGFLDDRRAVKLGVTAEEVAAYRGPTGPAGARVAGLRSSIDELRRRRSTDLQIVRFTDVAKTRLADLNSAVQTAASMPASRRRGTLVAVNKELNQIEADLMTYLVGNRG